jgi:hypothetical protein
MTLQLEVVGERIPRNAVVFMKVAGDEKFNLWRERRARKQAKKGTPLISITEKKWVPFILELKGSPWSMPPKPFTLGSVESGIHTERGQPSWRKLRATVSGSDARVGVPTTCCNGIG